ncbi:hypothetical protein EJ03DRAFT_147875 [Teratosphaeria nubilosa]|uniref:Uncharacterized protein n=1 Tax=Teratosphaeria nubilosa TaxID=161662 RepID=A0A6G1L409_9PEZI|nr:hypothetical protein EJ03DRAFT_147875 [Teratosphaeria nubilosa]
MKLHLLTLLITALSVAVAPVAARPECCPAQAGGLKKAFCKSCSFGQTLDCSQRACV